MGKERRWASQHKTRFSGLETSDSIPQSHALKGLKLSLYPNPEVLLHHRSPGPTPELGFCRPGMGPETVPF